MLRWRLPLSLLVSLGLILSVSGTPAPPPLQHTGIPTADGFAHLWHGWEQDKDFQKSSLPAYVQVAHDEMSRQAAMDYLQAKKYRPHTLASLWVENKGIYTASDLGNTPCRMVAPLHPKTQALYDKCHTRPNRYGAYCSCIQALNGFHTMFPDDDIPRGSEMAIYGYRGDTIRPNKILSACNADKFGCGCWNILSAAGIKYHCRLRAPNGKRRRYKPKLEFGSNILHSHQKPRTRPSLKAHRNAVPDLNLHPVPYVSSDEPISVSSSDHT